MVARSFLTDEDPCHVHDHELAGSLVGVVAPDSSLPLLLVLYPGSLNSSCCTLCTGDLLDGCDVISVFDGCLA